VCSAALGASAPTEGGEGRGHIVVAGRLQLVWSDLGLLEEVNVLSEGQCGQSWKKLFGIT